MRFQYIMMCVGAMLLSACGEPAETSSNASADPVRESAAAAAPPITGANARPASFAQCVACHRVEPGKNGIGPSLAGVFGAKAGHVGDYAYSSAMRQSGITWDEASLDRYLENPRKVVPNTKMSFAGQRDPAKRAELIEYLKTL